MIEVDARRPDQRIIASAADILRKGGLVAFPTETVYGLGANALNAAAVAKIFRAKSRPAWNPLIVHTASIEAARALTTAWNDFAETLAYTFWPGPLTLVLPRHHSVPDIVTAGLPAVGIRVPSHPVAVALIKALNTPIAAPSANRFTELSPTTAAHVAESLGSRVDLILNGGPCDVGIESTVLDLSGLTPTILRPGTITHDAISDALGAHVAFASHDSDEDGAARLSPGRTQKHYAPRASLWLFDNTDTDDIRRAANEHLARAADARVAALVLDWSLSLPDTVRAIPMPRDPLAYARALYATLHELDGEAFSVVAIERPPRTDAWAGVHDRLERAAHSAI